MCYLCSILFNVDKNAVFVNFVNKTPGMLYMVLVCIQNCLSLKLANSLNTEFTLTLQGYYIIAMYNCIGIGTQNRQTSFNFQ